MNEKPLALVIRSPGANCDRELVRAFELAGAGTELVHVDALIDSPRALERADLVGFPGGFSYGDDIASGRALAVRLRERLYPALREAAQRGAPMIGVCNGFQVLCQVGLLPGPAAAGVWPEQAPPMRAALAENAGARFIDRWLPVAPEEDSVCLWTKGLWDDNATRADAMRLPIAHGEGRFVPADEATLALLEKGGQVALRYLDNANGSTGAIAGVCDASGRIFGLMPHPERYLDWTRHPYWTRLGRTTLEATTPGRRMFLNAVEAVTGAPTR